MKFPYRAIFKQALGILKTHKFLWILGLFLVLPLTINLLSNDWIGLSLPTSPLISLVVFLIGIVFVILSYRAGAAIILVVKKTSAKQPSFWRISAILWKIIFS